MTARPKQSEEIVRIFFDFFECAGHNRIAGASLLSKGDPTLLFASAGMAPLKDYFLGLAKPPSPRLCNVQGCIRMTDIEEVGDRSHMTYFNMLGSWSIGDYWKDRAIELAFELLIEGFEFPKEKLYATIYKGDEELGIPPDEEAARAWERVSLPNDHIVPLGEDNFWGPAGKFGPCGPCTEVFYDTGAQFGPKYRPGGHFDDVNRYIEIWNAGVFMQYNKTAGGLEPLAIKSVDTGSGLERLLMTCNSFHSVYETDVVAPIVDSVREQLGGIPDEGLSELIADHVRATAYILFEGLEPSNTGAGYIPRRLIRRSIASLAVQHIEDFSFDRVLDAVFAARRSWQPDIAAQEGMIRRGFHKEARQFEKTLDKGLKRLEALAPGDAPSLSGEEVFGLFATHGLPIDVMRDIVAVRGGTLDEERFQKLYEQHQLVSQADDGNSKALGESVADLTVTAFSGYDTLTDEGEVLRLFVDGEQRNRAEADAEVAVVLDRTSFYAESGGQIGDRGEFAEGETVVSVTDVQKTKGGQYLHLGRVQCGTLVLGDRVRTTVDAGWRREVRAHHSATHLLQAALRRVLGDHAVQSGSLVESGRLRFDFKHEKKMTADEIREAESLVNRWIRANHRASKETMTHSDAIAGGAIAMLGEKYGDEVRVVALGDVSKELCGGTHVDATGEIGPFLLVSEGSVGRGVRRVNALVGEAAVEQLQRDRAVLAELSAKVGVGTDDLVAKLEERLRKARKAAKSVDGAEVSLADLKSGAQELADGTRVIAARVEPGVDLHESALDLAAQIEGVACLLSTDGDRVGVAVAVHKPLTERFRAQDILAQIAPVIGARGGGRSQLAEGGGENPGGIPELVRDFADTVGA